MRTKNFIIAAAVLLLPTVAFAQVSARDADIDAKLDAGALTGIAPPTGSQAASAPASASQKFRDPYLPAVIQSTQVILGQNDGKARVYQIKGNVFLIKKGSPEEVKLKKGDMLVTGDTLYTESNSTASITFDENYKNAVKITENSKAILEGVEPTNIRIINGSIFSAVDGLPQGSTWKVSTPAAITAVRGTLYIVRYLAANGQFFAATVNVPDDGKASAIDIQEISGNDSANVPEGKEISLKQGESPDDSLVKDLDPSVLDEILEFFKNLVDLRADSDNSGQAPPTAGDYSAPGALDSAGPGVMGWGENRLDQLDTGTLPEQPLPLVEEENQNPCILNPSSCEVRNPCEQNPYECT